MEKILDISMATVQKVIVHQVGNKFRDEGVLLSDAESERSADLDELLLKYFLKPIVDNGDEYTLTHESDIKLNPINHYTSRIFESEKDFIPSSVAIAKHLYACSSHPNIGGGEFIEVLYDGIKSNDKIIRAIGLFRIESKNSYLDIKKTANHISLFGKKGIPTDSIQKGAIILSVDNDVFVIDNLGRKTKYWLDDFVKAIPKATSKIYMKVLGSIAKAVSNKIDSPQDIMKFSNILNEESSLSVNQLREISCNFIREDAFDSIISGISVRNGIDINPDFLVEKNNLSSCIKDIMKKIKVSKGIDLIISEPRKKVKSINILNTEFGFRAIIDIQEGE